MSQNENGSSSDEQKSEEVALELYKTAFARLNFQDEYLFKFGTVFLTAQGALGVLAGSAVLRDSPNSPSYLALAIISVIGLFLAYVWWLWTGHNDYWHSVWDGTLREIENTHLGKKTKARVFDQEHNEVAKGGGRSKPRLKGHCIAQLVPIGLGVVWAFSLACSIWVLLVCK